MLKPSKVWIVFSNGFGESFTIPTILVNELEAC